MASSTTNPPPPGLKPKARRNWNKKGLEAHQKESEDAPPEQPPDAAAERKNWYAIKRIAIPFFIRFLARASLAWEIGLYVIIVLNYGLTTYGCFFTYYNESVWNTVLYTDILYAVDVVMRLSVELWRFNNQAEVLVFTLPYTFFNCFLDLVSLFPSYAIAAQFYDTDSFSHLFWLDYYRLNKFLRLVRAFKFFEVLKVRRLISEEGYFLLTFTNIYLIFINFVSCIFFLFTGLQPVDFLLWRNFTQIDDSWAKEFRKKKPGYGKDPLDFYILSTHFSTATVTTVGYGDVHGENAAEMTACVVIMLIGAILMNGYFTSQITNFQLELDSARYDLFFRLEGILRYMKGIGMSDFFQEKVQLYYKCLWTYREGVDRVTFIEHIPKAVQDDMYYDICLEMFHKSYLFRDLDEAFLRAVSKIVKISMYNPDMILCRYGGYANQMYYILQGECQAMSKHDSSRRAAILRAGTIIGETNLFFSCPYTIAVETNTCCQFISIEKEELMACLNNFPSELSILRSRTQKKINQMYLKFKLFGEDPVCWVQRVTDKKYNKNDMNTAASLSTDMTARWGDEMNLVVTEDVLADADQFVIFETLCRNKKYKKNHVTPYMTCVVPEILNPQQPWIVYWNALIMIFALIYSFLGPYCFSFGAASQFQQYLCTATGLFQYLNEFMYIIDVLVEIVGACPVEGIYFKLKDGFQVKTRQPLFYLDILAAIPIELFGQLEAHDLLHAMNVILKSMKLWKVIRYLRFLDNVYPKKLFWFRLGQTFVVLMYGTHFIACIMFFIACPTSDMTMGETADDSFKCSDQGWIASYQSANDFARIPVPKELEPNALAASSPYLLSFHFSAATLTSAGFGDFSPQNIFEIMFTTLFQLIGFFLIGYYTALLTSALTCVVKPKLEFQQKLLAVRRFMNHYVLPESLQRRIIEHYELQFQFHYGINLPHGVRHYLFDSPDYIKHDVLYTDVVLLLDGIPLFSQTDSKCIIKMAERMKRYLIPPNVTFLNLGDVRRAAYAVRFGCIGIFDGRSEAPQAILEATSYFGLRDLLFGEPSHFNHVTLSYCVIYEITQNSFLEVFEDDEELNEYLDVVRGETKLEVEEMCRTYSRLRRAARKDRAMEVSSWIYFKEKQNDKKSELTYREYYNYFDEFMLGKFLRVFLMNGVIHPAGLFARWWTCWMSLVSCLVLCQLVIETFMYYRTPGFRMVQYGLDLFLFMDIYVKLHWAYFLPDGLLVTHPLKTAGMYVFEGNFVFDVLVLAHPEMMLYVLGYTSFLGYGLGATWYTKLRWIRFIQIKRISPIFKIIHSVFEYRNAILFFLYVMMTLLVCTIVAAIALAIGCPWEANDWNDGDQYKLPFCHPDTWAVKKGDGLMHNFSDRWIVGVYYVCQVILVVGFGDMITLKTGEVYLLIFMSIFGFIFMRCIVADITAAEVDSDEVRSNYIDQMHRLKKILNRENVSQTIIRNVLEHLKHSWKQSKGLQSRELFSDLHPALETDLYEAFVGDRLGKVPLFEGLPPSILRNICKYVKKIYFLTGERLSRFGNLEYHMYIIVSGKVWVTDRFLNYGCTLHKNETFGESGVIGQIPGRFTIIACENVEIFAISHADFETILNRYPVVKTILSLRTGNGHYDFFENKIHDMIDWLNGMEGEEKDHRVDALVARTQVIKHLVYGREDPRQEDLEDEDVSLFKRKKRSVFISFGTDDDNLPLLYFVAQRSRKTGKLTLFPPLLHPNCGFLKLFLSLISYICLLSPAVSTFELCFPPVDKKYLADPHSDFINTFSDVMAYCMVGFIILRIFMSYKDSEGTYVKSSWCVAVNYFCSPSGIWLDLAAAIPSFVCPDPSSTDTRLRYFRISRALWLFRYFAHHFDTKDDLSVSTFQFKIKISVVSFVFMAHILACIFYTISACLIVEIKGELSYQCSGNYSVVDTPIETWTHKFIEDSGRSQHIDCKFQEFVKPWRWYVRSLYWVVTVVSTTGFGDITPRNVNEMIMGIVAVFSGAFILSIILSHFTAGMASLSKAHREYIYQVKLLVKYLRNIGLSSLRQELVQLYFETVWANVEGNFYHKAARILPPSLQIEVSHALFESVLSQVKFFKCKDTNFIRQVASRVEHSVYLPGVCIVKEGDQGNAMYVVYKGRVSGIVDGVDIDNELKNIYLVGDTFGRFPALFFDEAYKKSYRAEEYTEVLAISQHDMLSLTKLYEDFWKILLTYIDKKYDASGSAECIFSNQREKISDILDLKEYNRKKQEEKEKELRDKHDVNRKLDKKKITLKDPHGDEGHFDLLDDNSTFHAAPTKSTGTQHGKDQQSRTNKKSQHHDAKLKTGRKSYAKIDSKRKTEKKAANVRFSATEVSGINDADLINQLAMIDQNPATEEWDNNPIQELYEVVKETRSKRTVKKKTPEKLSGKSGKKQTKRNSPAKGQTKRHSPATTQTKRHSPATTQTKRNSPATTQTKRNSPATHGHPAGPTTKTTTPVHPQGQNDSLGDSQQKQIPIGHPPTAAARTSLDPPQGQQKEDPPDHSHVQFHETSQHPQPVHGHTVTHGKHQTKIPHDHHHYSHQKRASHSLGHPPSHPPHQSAPASKSGGGRLSMSHQLDNADHSHPSHPKPASHPLGHPPLHPSARGRMSMSHQDTDHHPVTGHPPPRRRSHAAASARRHSHGHEQPHPPQ